jgi:uncharacterized small protein (DUF1192 family)
MGERSFKILRDLGIWATILLSVPALSVGQNAPGPHPANASSDAGGDLQAQIRALQISVARMQSRIDSMQAETEKLRAELRETRARLSALDFPPKPPSGSSSSSRGASPDEPSQSDELVKADNNLQNRLSNLEEEQQLLKSKVDDQYQTKVESASKYRVRLSGMALLNVFSNRGNVDNQDVPRFAQHRGPLDSNATFGATVRQSTVGLDVSGPTLAGARTHGEVQMDFYGGFPNTLSGVTAGIMRMRTATFQMDWENSSLTAGQDMLFFSPLSPTSLASIAEPAFSYAGNLWAWTPQIRLEHRFNLSETSKLILEGGILDSLTGEPPVYNFYRTPQAGERSGQPGYATRIAWSASAFGETATVGVGGYYAPENWGFGRKIDGWAGTADWDLPLGRGFSFSGELYRGYAIGGLGGGIGRSVLYNGSLISAATSVLGLNSAGGWGQLKFHPTERLEFNGAFGEDQSFAADLHRFLNAQSYFNAAIEKNQGSLVNFIYHLRSNLLLSLEYRRLWTTDVNEEPYRANQINLGVGVLF